MPISLKARLLHRALHVSPRFFRGSYGSMDDIPIAMPEEGEVALSEVKLRYLRWPGPSGTTGRPLILLHGLNNSAWIWARVGGRLAAQGREVISVSQRGHGGSTAPFHGYSLDETTADLEAFSTAMGISSFDLAGHSWGGKVAMHFAALHPDRIRSLVLADPAPPAGMNPIVGNRRLFRAGFQPERGPYADRQDLERSLSMLLQHQAFDETDRRIWGTCFHAMEDGTWRHVLPDTAFDEIAFSTLRADIEFILPRLTGPVLLMRPSFNISFLPHEMRKLRKELPRLAEARISGDHSFIHTNPVDTVRVMAPFLEG